MSESLFKRSPHTHCSTMFTFLLETSLSAFPSVLLQLHCLLCLLHCCRARELLPLSCVGSPGVSGLFRGFFIGKAHPEVAS